MASTSRIATKLPLEMLYHWERQCPDRIYLRQTIHREYVDFTWGEVADEARREMQLTAHGVVAGAGRIGERVVCLVPIDRRLLARLFHAGLEPVDHGLVDEGVLGGEMPHHRSLQLLQPVDRLVHLAVIDHGRVGAGIDAGVVERFQEGFDIMCSGQSGKVVLNWS